MWKFGVEVDDSDPTCVAKVFFMKLRWLPESRRWSGTLVFRGGAETMIFTVPDKEDVYEFMPAVHESTRRWMARHVPLLQRKWRLGGVLSDCTAMPTLGEASFYLYEVTGGIDDAKA